MSPRPWIPNPIFDYIENPDEMTACREAFLEQFDLPDADMTLSWLNWQSAWRAAMSYAKQVTA